jgi:hypothetical protein
MGQDVASITEPFGCFPKGWQARYCHSSRGKTPENQEQKVNTEEKLALAPDRNGSILLERHRSAKIWRNNTDAC